MLFKTVEDSGLVVYMTSRSSGFKIFRSQWHLASRSSGLKVIWPKDIPVSRSSGLKIFQKIIQLQMWSLDAVEYVNGSDRRRPFSFILDIKLIRDLKLELQSSVNSLKYLHSA